MLVEKEVIRPGTYWYVEERTGLPRKLTVTPEFTKHLHDQGNAMLSAGLQVPVPYEHDFTAHPMTPKEKLLNNAGEVKQYTMRGDTLFSTVDVQDPEVKSKIGNSIRWTSPWISSFTDGAGKQWKNVISHLALTTRPRVTKQEPFASVAASLSMATEVAVETASTLGTGADGLCLSRAGRLSEDPETKQVRPAYPVAFSIWGGGIKLSEGDFLPKKEKSASKEGGKPAPKSDGKTPPGEGQQSATKEGDQSSADSEGLSEEQQEGDDFTDPLADASGDVCMEEVLCHLLQALGVPMPDQSNETEFKRHLYEAAMSKVKELTSKGMGNDANKDKLNGAPDQNKPPNQNPHASQPNPLISQVQQEQQPMYMSLEDINKLPDPMKGVALAMYAENQKLRAEMDASIKTTNSLRDAKLKEATETRTARASLLSRLSPRVKDDLDSMLAMPAMALSMGDGGAVIDPMEQTLAVLEKGLADMPRLLTMDQSALSLQPQPKDAEMLSDAQSSEIADDMARKMGCSPEKKAS